jgi:hypothetical protein
MPTVPGSANGSPGSCSASRVLSIAVVLAYAVIANGNYKRITRNHGVDYGLGLPVAIYVLLYVSGNNPGGLF